MSAEIFIDGHPVTLIDTAGIEESLSSITTQSQLQGNRAADKADIRIWCVDSSSDTTDLETLRSEAQSGNRRGVTDIWLATKSDLSGSADHRPGPFDWIDCSTITGQGIETLQQRIVESIETRDAEEVGSVIGTAARCGQSIDGAREAIAAAIHLTQNGDGHEFVSSELRLCANHLGEVTGAVYTDDILDRVFGRFCIGK